MNKTKNKKQSISIYLYQLFPFQRIFVTIIKEGHIFQKDGNILCIDDRIF